MLQLYKTLVRVYCVQFCFPHERKEMVAMRAERIHQTIAWNETLELEGVVGLEGIFSLECRKQRGDHEDYKIKGVR